MTTNVKLTSSDGQHFEVEEQYASESQMIKNMVEGEISSCKTEAQQGRLKFRSQPSFAF